MSTQRSQPISVEQCRCGSPKCQNYGLVGIGGFIQGSGFTKEDAEKIARAYNAHNDMLAALRYCLDSGFLADQPDDSEHDRDQKRQAREVLAKAAA